MDPTRRPGECSFEEAILYEQSFGRPRAQWDADYAVYARAKAKISWRTGRDSHQVHATAPHLLAADDWPVWGSAVVDGIAVGASGAEAIYDEALAGTVAMFFRALVKRALAESR
jgi:hypothetical protein